MLFNTIVQLLTTLEAILEEITSPIQMLLLLHQDSTRISPGEQVVLRAEEIEVEEGVDFGLALVLVDYLDTCLAVSGNDLFTLVLITVFILIVY